ncbi:MAG TPA: hypothetical protein VGK19_20980 [Capsulimonadaceae bacterium]|jgi:hypothetical protein
MITIEEHLEDQIQIGSGTAFIDYIEIEQLFGLSRPDARKRCCLYALKKQYKIEYPEDGLRLTA